MHLPYAAVAKYSTTKTETTDINIALPKGVVQVRIVETANGHKRDVYAGFDPCDTSDLLAVEVQQKYFKQARNSAKKWGGTYEILGVTALETLADQYGFEIEGSVQEKLMSAYADGGKLPTAAEIEARSKQEWAQAQLAQEERRERQLREDEMFGCF